MSHESQRTLRRPRIPSPVSRNLVPLGGVIGRVDGPLEIGIALQNHVQHGLQKKRDAMCGNEERAAQPAMTSMR